MANPTFTSGPITFEVAEDVDKFHLVTAGDDGIRHAEPGDVVFGAVTENGHADDSGYVGIDLVKAARVAVHIGPSTVPLTTGDDVAPGEALYVASGGEVSTSGDYLVAVAARASSRGRVNATLLTPAVPTESAPGDGGESGNE